jgi:hypothetical protein
VRNIDGNYSAPSELHGYFAVLTRGDAPHVVRRLPLAVIFRAALALALHKESELSAKGAQYDSQGQA